MPNTEDNDRFTNKHPPERLIQSGQDFVIVYDWLQPWEAIRTEAERIKAYVDVDGVRWYLVMFARMTPVAVHELDSERLEFFVTTLHQELRSRAN